MINVAIGNTDGHLKNVTACMTTVEYTLSEEIIFGMPDQKLTLRHDAGSSARPYVDGALLAIRKVNTLVSVHRGLDHVLYLEWQTIR